MGTTFTRIDFELNRSDLGDGGWSLHLPGQETWILSGPGSMGPDGSWARPDERDYLLAAYLVAAGEQRGVDAEDIDGFGGSLYSVREIMLRAGADPQLAEEAEERLAPRRR